MSKLQIPAKWTPEQAMAIVDLLDDLREQIWGQYELGLLEAYRDDRCEHQLDLLEGSDEEEPF